MQEIVLKAEYRKLGDAHSLKEARKKGLVPGIFYRKDIENIPFYVKDLSLKNIIYSVSATIVNLMFPDNKQYPSVVKEVQYDPITDQPIHVDFLGIFEDKPIIVEVPVILSGTPAGQKDGGLTQHLLHKLKVECLPKYIPQSISVDISPLNIGDSIHIKDIKIENVTFREREDATVVAVIPPTVEAKPVQAAEAATETAEPEVVASKGKKEEEE